MQREYFCLVSVEIDITGGVKKKLMEFTLTVDRSRIGAEGLYWEAVNQVVRELTKYGKLQDDQITVTNFNFYPNQL